LPAYFNNNLYHVATPLNLLQGEKGPLKYTPDFFKQFAIVSGLIQEAPASRSKQDFGQKYSNTPSISANVSSDGIVWVIRAEGYQPGVPATLYAFDASDLGNELYNSNMAGARDQPGMGLKFTVPTIADGKVFVGTQSEVTVYGLLNP
jgi:outer membrane protein assembly factor BamB